MSRGLSMASRMACGGDLVEHHPLDRHRRRRVQHLEQVPGDGLALAILIRREIELGGVLQLGLELADDVLLVRADHVERLEVVVDVDAEDLPTAASGPRARRPRLRGQVADVADRRLDDDGGRRRRRPSARKPAMVFALAGDSTMTRGFAIADRLRARRAPCQERLRPRPPPAPSRRPDPRARLGRHEPDSLRPPRIRIGLGGRRQPPRRAPTVGRFTVLGDDEDCKVKRITVDPGQRLSYQRHEHRSEHWVVVAGERPGHPRRRRPRARRRASPSTSPAAPPTG